MSKSQKVYTEYTVHLQLHGNQAGWSWSVSGRWTADSKWAEGPGVTQHTTLGGRWVAGRFEEDGTVRGRDAMGSSGEKRYRTRRQAQAAVDRFLERLPGAKERVAHLETHQDNYAVYPEMERGGSDA